MEINPLDWSFYFHEIPFKVQTTLHYLVKLSLFSWQRFCLFHVRQINSEGKSKCSLSVFFFFLDWHFNPGLKSSLWDESSENPNIWRRQNSKITRETPRSSEKAPAWGNTHLYKLPLCMKLLRIFAVAHGRPIYMDFVTEANHILSQTEWCLLLNK